MTKIKAKITEKQVKLSRLSYDYRHHNKTHRTEREMIVTVSGLNPSSNRVVALDLGQLGRIIQGLKLLQSAQNLMHPTILYEGNYTTYLLASLEAIAVTQPGFPTVEAKGFEKKPS